MEFERNSVIAHFLAGKSQPAIVRELQHLNVNKVFVYRTIERFKGTGSTKVNQGKASHKTATAPETVRKVKKRLKRNPAQSANKMAKDLNISQSSIRRILKDVLYVKPYKKVKLHDLTDAQKKVRLERAKALKRRAASGELPNHHLLGRESFHRSSLRQQTK